MKYFLQRLLMVVLGLSLTTTFVNPEGEEEETGVVDEASELDGSEEEEALEEINDEGTVAEEDSDSTEGPAAASGKKAHGKKGAKKKGNSAALARLDEKIAAIKAAGFSEEGMRLFNKLMHSVGHRLLK